MIKNESKQPKEGKANKRTRLAKLRNRLLFSVFLILAMLASSLYIINTKFGSDTIIAFANTFISQFDDSIFIRAEIRFDYLHAGISIKNLTITYADQQSFESDEIYLELKPFQIFFDRIVLTKVQIGKPRLELDLTKKLPFDFEGSKESSFNFPFDFMIEHFDLVGGELQILGKNEKLTELDAISLSAIFRENAYEAYLETGSGQVVIDKIDFPINLITAKASYTEGAVNLKDLHIFSQDMDIATSGIINNLGQDYSEIDISLELPLAKINETIADIPPLKGQAKLTGKLSGTVSNPVCKGLLKIHNGKIADVILENMNLKFLLNKKGIWLDNSLLYFALGEILVTKGELLFEKTYPINLELKLKDVELAHILDNVSHLHSKTMQWQSGIITLGGTIQPLKVKGFADLQILNHATYSVGYRNRSKHTLITSIPKGRIKVKLYGDDTRFEMHSGTVKIGKTVVMAKLCRFGFNNIFEMEYSSNDIDLADVGIIAGLDLGGRGSLLALLHIDDGDLEINGWLDMKNLSVEGFQLGNTKTDVHFKNLLLSFKNIDAIKNKSVYHANVGINFNSSPLSLSFEFATDKMLNQDLLQIVGLQQSLGDIITGHFVGNGSMQGKIGNFNGSAKLVFPEFSTKYQKLDSAKMEISIVDNTLNFERVLFELGDARLKVTGEMPNFDKFNINFNSEGFEVTDIDALGNLFKGSNAGVHFSGKIRGSTKDFVFTSKAKLDQFWMDDKAYESSEMHLELTPKFLDLDGKLFKRQITYSLLFQFERLNLLDVEIKLNKFAYSPMLKRLLDLEFNNGLIDADIFAKVPLRNFKRATGFANIKNFSGNIGEVALKSERQAKISLNKGIFKLDPIKIIGEDIAFEIRGDIDFDNQMNALLKGKSSLHLLAPFTDTIEQSEGLGEFDFTLSGNWSDLSLVGKTIISHAKLKIKGFDGQIENLQGTVLFDVNQIMLDNIHLQYNGGKVNIDGHIMLALPAMDIGQVDLRIDLLGVGFKLDDGIVPMLSGRLSLSGQKMPLILGGELKVDELIYSKNIIWQKKLILDNIKQMIKPRKHRTTEELKPVVRFDVDIQAPGTIRLKNNIADFDITADLKLVGDNLDPGLLNTLSTDRGRFFFQQNEFEIQRFMIEFTKPDKIYPRFDILGETLVSYVEHDEKKEVRISLNLRGDLDEVEVVLQSDAGLSHTDIVMLLLIGQPASAMEGQSGVATGLNALSGLYGVDDQIRTQLKLDEFRLTSEYVSSSSGSSTGVSLVPRLVIGKEIAEDLYLTYSTALGNQETQQDQSFQIRYRMEHFTVSAEWNNNSTLQYGNFGADLKFHLDF